MTLPTPVHFEVSWQCPSCKQPLLVNGVTESMHCGACQSVVATPPDFWRDILGDALGYALDWEDGQTTTMTVMNQWGSLSVFYGRSAARCPSPCDAVVSPAELEAALQSGSSCTCTTCGEGVPVRRAPEWFRQALDARVVGLAGECHVSETAGSGADPASVRFHCFGCGAAVPLDGKERQVTCAFCQTSLVIPDAIWVRLHPAPKLSRWYVLLSERS